MRPQFVLVAVVLALAVSAYVLWPQTEPAHCCARHHVAHVAPALEPTLAGASLYRIDGAFTDQDGRPFALASLRGEPVLVAMFYASCTTVCPLIVAELQRIEAALPEADRGHVRIVLVTIDPARDTAERLRAMAVERGLDAPHWTLLRGDADTVRELAMALGVQYRRTADGDFVHSALVTLLDSEGRIAAQLDGLDAPMEPLVTRLRELVTPRS